MTWFRCLERANWLRTAVAVGLLVGALPLAGHLTAPRAAAQQDAAGRAGTGSAPADYHKAWYVVDRLNSGLDTAPRSLDRSTPRSAVASFLDAADAGDLGTAAHVLDLSPLPETEQATRGRELARKLAEVMAQRVWIDWQSLPDRPDGLVTSAVKGDPLAGEPRRSHSITELEVNGRPVSIRVDRLRPGDGSPVWVFAPQTVAAVDALHEAYGPGPLQQQLPAWLRDKQVGELALWEIGLLLLIMAGAALTVWLVRWLLGMVRARSGSARLNAIIRAARMPLAVLAGIVMLRVTVGMVPLSGPVNSVLYPLLVVGFIGALTWLALRSVDAVLDFVSEMYVWDVGKEENQESRRLYTNLSVIRRVVLLVAFLAATGLVLIQLNLFRSFGLSLLASAGILSLVFGFAAQTVLGNVLSSLQIAIAKPIRIGDTVYYDGKWGYVEQINYTYVMIRVWNDRRLIVPVKYFVSHPFENWSVEGSHVVNVIELVVDHRTDVDALRKKFVETVKANEDWDSNYEPKTLVIAHSEEGMTVRFYASAKDADAAWALECAMREEMLAYLRELEDGRYLPRTRLRVENGGEQPPEAAADGSGERRAARQVS